MNTNGIILICLGGLLVSILVFQQLMTNRLYVGYAAAWLIVISGVVCFVAIPPLNRAAIRLAEKLFPADALTLVSLGFVLLVLVYFSVQLSIISERVVKIAQSLAISSCYEEDAESGNTTESLASTTKGQ